jgi:hypothetical protein
MSITIRKVESGDFDSLIEMLAEMSRVPGMQDRMWIARDDIPDSDIRRASLNE